MNRIFENIYNANNKNHLKENDFYVGSTGVIQPEIEIEEKPINEIPDFVKQFFGYENGPALVAEYPEETEFSDYPDDNITDGLVKISYDSPHGDDCDCNGCCGSECDCTHTNVEYKRADEVGKTEDSCVGEWLDLNNLRDESPLASVISLISKNFNRNAHSESGTNCDTVLTVDNLTDTEEIRELIDVISGTLNSGGFGIEGYRLCDGNLQLKIGR